MSDFEARSRVFQEFIVHRRTQESIETRHGPVAAGASQDAVLFHRLTRVTKAQMGELDQMASALHEAEQERDRSLAEASTREAELLNRLRQAEAECNAAMDGLRDARREAEELRGYVEKMNAG